MCRANATPNPGSQAVQGTWAGRGPSSRWKVSTTAEQKLCHQWWTFTNCVVLPFCFGRYKAHSWTCSLNTQNPKSRPFWSTAVMVPTFLPPVFPTTIPMRRSSKVTKDLCLDRSRISLFALSFLTSQQHSAQWSPPASLKAFFSDFWDLHCPGVRHTGSFSSVSFGNSSSPAILLNTGVPQARYWGTPFSSTTYSP